MRLKILAGCFAAQVLAQTKYCFDCEYRESKNLDGQIIAESGNINCWKNLGADDQSDIQIAQVDFYDVCYTRRETSVTNTTEETVIRRGVYYGIFSNEITYPFYSNRTSESVQCSSDFCNNDESFYENSVTKFDNHDENVTCYTCTGQRDTDPDSCRMPNESTPTCEGDYCITQIVSRYNEIADGILRYIFNRGCVKDNIEDPGNNPFTPIGSLNRNEGGQGSRDVVRSMSEDWICDESFCNVGLEDQRECFECSDFVEDGEDLSLSDCLSGTTGAQKVMINSDKVCSISVTFLELMGQSRTQIVRAAVPRENLAYPVRRNKWAETDHCTGNSCNLGNGQFGPNNGIAPIAPPSGNHYCLTCFDDDVLGDARPGNWGCWSNPFSGRVLECPGSECTTVVDVEQLDEGENESSFTYSVSRGCKSMAPDSVQIGKEYLCSGNNCNDLTGDSIDLSPPNPSGTSGPIDTDRKFKTCFECEYSFLRSIDGSDISESGTENCLKNLSANDIEITMTEAGQNDVCFTQIREELTNGTDLITLTRGIYRNQYASTSSYPQYSNQTDESFTCTTNLCNNDVSTFRNRNGQKNKQAGNQPAGNKPESFNEQFTGECYSCTDTPTNQNPACRDPTPELVASGALQTCSGSYGSGNDERFVIGCLTQIDGQFDDADSNDLVYRINRRCILSEPPQTGPGRSNIQVRQNDRDVTIDAQETLICNEPYCNVFREPHRECYDCIYQTDSGDANQGSESCASDASSATKMNFQSDMVCTVKLTQSTQSPRGTRFSRGLESRGELSYPAWKNTYQENENCDATGCNYGNGKFGPYFGVEIFVEPPSSSFQCQTCYESIELTNAEPENESCWGNEYNGEFETCSDGCFKTIKVEYDQTRSDDPMYTWAVQRGCKASVSRPDTTQVGLEYHCTDGLCNTWTIDDMDTALPVPPGGQMRPTTTTVTTTTATTTTATTAASDEATGGAPETAFSSFICFTIYILYSL